MVTRQLVLMPLLIGLHFNLKPFFQVLPFLFQFAIDRSLRNNFLSIFGESQLNAEMEIVLR